ncbi:MAG: nicotinate phosphoribosyltransferase [Candidatus Dormibacteraceae bacterium]
MPGGLKTDLYELKMAASYLRRQMVADATFSLFVRRLPRDRGYLVAAGLEDCLDFLEGFGFESEDLDYLGSIGFGSADLDAFRSLHFTGEVWAVPEGRVVLANEPLLEVTAPIAEAQLVETAMLNYVTYQTTLAAKAARCRLAAGGRPVIDFAYRRTQGLEAASSVARVSAMVGFAGTSNVEAARHWGLTASGTMAHSYIEAFEHEEEAYASFAADFPDQVTFLVDTYDPVEGIRRVIHLLQRTRHPGQYGVRLDSGDLQALARTARAMLDGAGLEAVSIFASGGLDEYSVEDLVRSGAPIDAYGVGTRMGVAADHPYVDTAYKLVAFDGRPMMKLSAGKTNLPGAKQVFRDEPGRQDVISLRGEKAPGSPLLERVMHRGRRLRPRPALTLARARFESDLAWLPESALRIRGPRAPLARVSKELNRLSQRTRERIRRYSQEPGA